MLYIDQTAMLHVYTIYCILMMAFLLLSAILYFMCLHITPSKVYAHAG